MSVVNSTKITSHVVDLQSVIRYFIENNWLRPFRKLTTIAIGKLRAQLLKAQYLLENRNYNNSYLP